MSASSNSLRVSLASGVLAIRAEPPKSKMKDGKPVEVFTYFFYVPGHPNVVVTDLDKPLDKQT